MANLNIVSMCAVSPAVRTSNIYSCQKKPFFSFPVAVNNSIKVGPLGFLLLIFAITDNIMKRPVLLKWTYGVCIMSIYLLKIVLDGLIGLVSFLLPPLFATVRSSNE